MQVYEVLLRLLLAVIVGGLIGYEREFKNRPAGFRTHTLVCVGAAVISMIQLYTIQDATNLILKHPELEGALKADIGRLGAQVVTGVGFLGAGTIMRDKGSVKGLTTAASIWSVACIGLAVGLGYYSLSVMSTICVFMVLVSLKKFETRFIDRMRIVKLFVQHDNKPDSIHRVTNYFRQKKIKVKDIEFDIENFEEEDYTLTIYTLLVPKEITEDKIMDDLHYNEDIIKAKVL